MADYTIISDVGNALVRLLRETMVPDIIQNADAIGLCSPSDKGDYMLGLYLYNIRESEEVFDTGMRPSGQNLQRYPSVYLNLFYMLTAYSMSDIKFRAAEEQRMIGRAIQVMADHPVLDAGLFGNAASVGRYPIRVEQQRLGNEERMRLWNMPNIPYKLSMYYKVFPVEIESSRIRNVQRVQRVDMDVAESSEEPSKV